MGELSQQHPYGDYDGKRGVHIPDGMIREDIVGIARIVHANIDIDRYLANSIARQVLSYLRESHIVLR
jgi:hypothetical protein